MNIFLPEDTVIGSVKALDDRRLQKQILECKELYDIAMNPDKRFRHKYHPVSVHYKSHPDFVAYVGLACCSEYSFRRGKNHAYDKFFVDNTHYYLNEYMKTPIKPFYCEGLKSDPNHIRTTENTVELFRNKLCKKWNNDKYTPTWTNRKAPEWYKNNRSEL